MKAIHNKTNKQYYIDDVIIDTSNELEVEEKVKILYHDDKGRFIREAHEFFEKFEVPEGLSILAHLYLSTLQQVKDYEDKKANVVECVKETICNFHDPFDNHIDDPDIHHQDIEKICKCCSEESEDDEDFIEDVLCSVAPYIGEIIAKNIYDTYHQEKSILHQIPVYIVKSLAFEQLDKLFTIRCNEFYIEEKLYDNATSDYFLVGAKTRTGEVQVCKIPKEVYKNLLSAATEYDTKSKISDAFIQLVPIEAWKARKVTAENEKRFCNLPIDSIKKNYMNLYDRFADMSVVLFDVVKRYHEKTNIWEYFLVGVITPGLTDSRVIQITKEAFETLVGEYLQAHNKKPEVEFKEDCAC